MDRVCGYGKWSYRNWPTTPACGSPCVTSRRARASGTRSNIDSSIFEFETRAPNYDAVKGLSSARLTRGNKVQLLIDGEATDEDIETASRIVARFSQGKNEDSVTVKITHINGDEQTVNVLPMPPSEIKQEWYV